MSLSSSLSIEDKCHFSSNPTNLEEEEPKLPFINKDDNITSVDKKFTYSQEFENPASRTVTNRDGIICYFPTGTTSGDNNIILIPENTK